MSLLVHIAPEPETKKIRRNGIAARRFANFIDGHDRFVWAFPVLPSYTLTHQWSRELKRWKGRTLAAVTFRIPDEETIFARHYLDRPAEMKAAEAAGVIRAADDPRGYEIIVPRRIAADEIVRVSVLPAAIGWRYWPEANNKPLRTCDCPMCIPHGEVNARRYRERVRAEIARVDRKKS